MKKNQNNLELLKKIEHLSNIKIEDERRDIIIGYISSVSDWFAALSSVDTSQVNSSLDALSTFSNPKNTCCDNILMNTKTEHGYFVVPKVIDE